MLSKTLNSLLIITIILFSAEPAIAEVETNRHTLREPCIGQEAKKIQETITNHSFLEREVLDLKRKASRLLGAPQTIKKGMEKIVETDGSVLLDGACILNGRDAQIGPFNEYFAAGSDLVWEPVRARASASEDMAWVIGFYKETRPNGSVDIGKFVYIR